MDFLNLPFEYKLEMVGLIVGIVIFIEGISLAFHEELPWYRENIKWYKHPRRRHLITSYPDIVRQ